VPVTEVHDVGHREHGHNGQQRENGEDANHRPGRNVVTGERDGGCEGGGGHVMGEVLRAVPV